MGEAGLSNQVVVFAVRFFCAVGVPGRGSDFFVRVRRSLARELNVCFTPKATIPVENANGNDVPQRDERHRSNRS
jgi:hypothetical protein